MHLQPRIDENLNTEITGAAAGVQVSGKSRQPISVLCLITSLNVGGAQTMLYRLLSRMDRTRFAPQVISMVDLELGPMNKTFETLGVPLRSLGMRPGRPNPVSILRLARWLRKDRPDVISTWLYHADLIGGMAAKLAGGIPVAWGIRHCDLSREGNKWLTLQTVKACALMSHWLPTRIVCNSEAARKTHVAAGYAIDKMMVIHNGSDLTMLKPDLAARESVRKELEIPEDAPLIGLVGRFDPQKDHHNFVQAAGLLHRDRPDVHFLLCGDDITWENPKLARWIQEADIAGCCRLLGRRADIPRLTAAFDIATSSSFGESFANVIAEAMSCAIPCVVTDVGESALILGQTGRVVPPKNPMALALAWRDLLDLGHDGRTQLGMAARLRIQEYFNLRDTVTRYENLYQDLADMKTEQSSTARIGSAPKPITLKAPRW
jgi:glycosyltransferase involved in cell wall biosynthesis